MLHPASSKESLLYSLVPTYMGKDIKFHFQGLPDISVSDASRFQWARVHMCCRSVLMMPWRPWVSLKNMGCHEAPHNPDNLLTRGLPSKASLLITPSGLIGLYWCLLCSPVSEAVANVCTPQFSSLLLYCTGVLFWQRNVNQPLTKANSEVKKKKKSKKKINKSSHFDGQTAGLEKVENAIMGALPHAIFWCFTGKGKSQVQRMVLCFLLFHRVCFSK